MYHYENGYFNYSWDFSLDNEVHNLKYRRFVRNLWISKIYFDGKMLDDEELITRYSVLYTSYQFTHNNHQIELFAYKPRFKCNDVTVDGISIITGELHLHSLPIPLWAWAMLAVIVIIMMNRNDSVSFAPAIGMFVIASIVTLVKDRNYSTKIKFVICSIITLFFGLLFSGIIYKF